MACCDVVLIKAGSVPYTFDIVIWKYLNQHKTPGPINAPADL